MANQAITFLMTSVVMSAIILILMLFNKLFSKTLSAKLRYTIWIIVLIGLIIPFRPVIGNGLILIESPSSVQTQPVGTQSLSAAEPVTDIKNTQNVQNTNSASALKVSPVRLCIYIWAIIVVIILAIHIWRYLRFARMIRHWGIPVNDEQILSIFKSVQSHAGLDNKKIDLKICNFISSSMLTGLFHPVILLPERHFDEDELQVIFQHELIHYKRHDLLVKILTVIATSIHWFNPIVYWMNRVMQADGEAACDETVLQDTDIENRRFYSEVIIGMISTKNTVRTPLSTCFYGGKSGIKRRLESIMDTKKKKKLTAIGIIPIAAIILLSGSVVAFSNNQATADVASEIKAERAQEIALATTGGGTVTECKMDYENGRKVYEIEVLHGDNKYEVDVDAINSTVLNYTVESIHPDSKSTATESTAKETSANTTESSSESSVITVEKAQEIALAKVGGGTVKEWEIDYKNGRKVYDIKIIYENKEYEMNVDAINGTITDYCVESRIPPADSNTNNSTANNSSKSNYSGIYHDDDDDYDHDNDDDDDYDNDHDDDD